MINFKGVEKAGFIFLSYYFGIYLVSLRKAIQQTALARHTSKLEFSEQKCQELLWNHVQQITSSLVGRTASITEQTLSRLHDYFCVYG
jgi:hypothetical protein